MWSGKKRPAVPRRTDLPFAARDQTHLAIFYGVLLGVDTLDTPELICADSITATQHARWSTFDPLLQHQFDHWGVYSIGYLSGHAPIRAFALIHLPSALGKWTFDERWAYVVESWHLPLTTSQLEPPVSSSEANAELETLVHTLGEELLATPSWHAVALVDLKHT